MPLRSPALLLLCFLLAACAPGRALESLTVLQDVATGAHANAERLGPVEIGYSASGRARTADLYRPAETRAAAGVVLVPGATPEGRRDPRLVAFARELAAARVAVLVPDLPGLRRLRMAAGHADPIADAVAHLSKRAGGGPVGVIAISYAAGPAVLAALRPELDARIGLTLLVGPYYDMQSALTYVTTGAYRTGAQAPWQFGQPNPRGIWLFIAGNTDRLPDARDRRLLRRIAARKRADPNAPVDRLADGRVDRAGSRPGPCPAGRPARGDPRGAGGPGPKPAGSQPPSRTNPAAPRPARPDRSVHREPASAGPLARGANPPLPNRWPGARRPQRRLAGRSRQPARPDLRPAELARRSPAAGFRRRGGCRQLSDQAYPSARPPR